jgi:hypothetical protein
LWILFKGKIQGQVSLIISKAKVVGCG